MSITFPCQSCGLKMTVPETMAGKKGRCSKCKGVVVVPSPAIVPPLPSAEDIEAAALDALSEPKKEAEKEADFVEFECPQCDEKVKLGLEHAGKRHPCPACGRIIVVPMPTKAKEENWRDTGPKKPAGAKREVGPALEGAWGAGEAKELSEETKRETGLIKERERPLTFYQKYQLHMLIAFPLVLLGVGGWYAWGWWASGTEAAAFKKSQQMESKEPHALAALALGTAEYKLRAKKANGGTEARDELSKALQLGQSLDTAGKNALLMELALAQVSLGGDTEAARDDKRLKWDDAQRILVASLIAIPDREPRLMALRSVAAALAEAGQSSRVQPIAALVGGSDKANQSEAMAAAGLGLLKAGQKDMAARLATQALLPFNDKKRPAIRASVVALAVALGSKLPKKNDDNSEDDAFRFGTIEGLALKGETEAAKQEAGKASAVADQFRAAVLAGDQAKALEHGVKPLPGIEWVRLRFAKEAGEAAGPVLDASLPEVRAWGRLHLLRKTLASSKSVVGEELEGLPPSTVAGLLARMELARHNCKLDSGWSAKLKDWDDASRAMGWLGAAQAMQK